MKSVEMKYIDILQERVYEALEEKKKIEEKLKKQIIKIEFMSPLSVGDKIIHNEVTQEVTGYEAHGNFIFLYKLMDGKGFVSYVPLREITPQKKKKMNLEKALEEIKDSAFNRYSYEVSVPYKNFVRGMMLYTDYSKLDEGVKLSPSSWLSGAVPKFQRDNKKWSKSMKVKFVENLFKGLKTEILLYRMNEDDDSLIIDGHQRCTAIVDFLEGRIKAFGLSSDELLPHINSLTSNLAIKIYTFNELKEVGRFYIEMNEGITHSASDIQKAKDWFLYKGIKL